MRTTLIIGFFILIWGCTNSKSSQFKDYLLGDWRIENPTLQSFIRFEKNGKTTYYFNQYSYRLDSLSEKGKWELKEIKSGKIRDTFIIEIDKEPQKTIFQFIPIDQQKIKVVDELGQTFFTRIK